MAVGHGVVTVAPDHRFERRDDNDVRPADIAMALGGCWALLAIIVYMTLSAMTADPYPGAHSGATVTLMPSVSSEQTN